jgi:hypothetical protein
MWYVMSYILSALPVTHGWKGFESREVYHNWTNSVFQQLDENRIYIFPNFMNGQYTTPKFSVTSCFTSDSITIPVL